jgi:hypothetical protein
MGLLILWRETRYVVAIRRAVGCGGRSRTLPEMQLDAYHRWRVVIS